MKKQRYYRYVLTLDAPMWPRTIADELSFARGIHDRLVSVTDLQNDTHSYGATYRIRGRCEHNRKMTGRWPVLSLNVSGQDKPSGLSSVSNGGDGEVSNTL